MGRLRQRKGFPEFPVRRLRMAQARICGGQQGCALDGKVGV
jgi:hypothetical protein